MGIGGDEIVLKVWRFPEAPSEFRALFSESSSDAWLANVLPQFADRSIESLFADWGMSSTSGRPCRWRHGIRR